MIILANFIGIACGFAIGLPLGVAIACHIYAERYRQLEREMREWVALVEQHAATMGNVTSAADGVATAARDTADAAVRVAVAHCRGESVN